MNIFLDVLTANQGVNYAFIVSCVGIYFLLLWLAVSFWVARDSSQRYGNRNAGILWFILVFFLNFPALMFYLVVRPDESFEQQKYSAGGVNVPLVNFVGKSNEILFGLEMKIHPSNLTETTRDMRLTVDWDSADPLKQLSPEEIAFETKQTQVKLNVLLKRLYSAITNKLGSRQKSTPEIVQVNNQIQQPQPGNKKHKKKHRR